MTQAPIDHIRLVRTAGIGPVAYRQLIARFGSAAAAIAAVPELAARGGRRNFTPCPVGVAEAEARRVAALGGRWLLVGQALYPRALAALDHAPPLLTVKGDLRLLDRPLVAMVGARNASAAACRFARGLAHDLGREGMVVVSGLARGIDSAAHDGALEEGTVAVIAGGLDVVYPPENADRQAAIGERGLLVAEMPPGTQPQARHFPARNRIIAGLALGTIVVEAAPRSGSLITARLAADAGREVMAVPGSPLDPRAQGCNQLIRGGATLVQSAADVIETVRPMVGSRLAEMPLEYDGPIAFEEDVAPDGDVADGQRRSVADLLGPVPVAVDELVRLSGARPGEVQLLLLEYDLAGRLERHAGGRVSLLAA